jgi:hypothetical protein
MSSTEYPPITTALEAELDAALHEVLDERDELKAEVARLQAQLDGLLEGFEKGGSLGILQSIGADKSWPIEVRVRALQAAVPFERPKLSMTATTNARPLFDILEAARLKDRRVIEAPPPAEPRKPLDFNEPTPSTVLGEGQGHHQAYKDHEPDPAA